MTLLSSVTLETMTSPPRLERGETPAVSGCGGRSPRGEDGDPGDDRRPDEVDATEVSERGILPGSAATPNLGGGLRSPPSGEGAGRGGHGSPSPIPHQAAVGETGAVPKRRILRTRGRVGALGRGPSLSSAEATVVAEPCPPRGPPLRSITSRRRASPSSSSSQKDRAVFGCPECGRTFTSKSGLGVHRQAKHREAYNAGIVVERLKARWTPEETYLLAKIEFELSKHGVRNINEAMHAHLCSRAQEGGAVRSLDSIKSHRRQPVYKEVLESLRRSADVELNPAPLGDSVVGRVPRTQMARSGEPLVAEASPRDKLVSELRGLVGRPAPSCRGASELWIIARQAIEGMDVRVALNNFLRELFFHDEAQRDTRRRNSNRGSRRPMSRRKEKRREYACVQELFRKRQGCCAREVLDGKIQGEVLDPERFLSDWESIMTGQPPPTID